MSADTGVQKQVSDNGAFEATESALAIVSQEVMESIRSAHLALEDCVDGRGGAASLSKCALYLHQVGGALRMTETYGAALLAEEMEAVCHYLGNLRPGKGREDGLEALTRSMVQLPVYIERLLGGGRDIALVLLPILNDLRAARGQPLLSEGTLLLLNLSPSHRPADGERKGSGEDPVALARKLRPKFQLALLGWIKGGAVEQHLQILSGVADALEKASRREDMRQLWWVTGGVLESLQNGGLETSVALKRLLGQVDRQLKLLIDEGADAFDERPLTDLLNNLLYYVARSSNAGPIISEIRAAFNLSELLPGDEQVEHAREGLSAPSVKLMQTVASAIREDLGRVKDVLDIYVRTGMNKTSDLVPQLDLLKKISDTLGVLGLGALRGDVDAEITRLKDVVARGGGNNEQNILEIAATLLRVEDRLDRQLTQLIVPRDPGGEPESDATDEEEDNLRQVTEAVMRECIINLARIKETFSQAMVSQGDSSGIDSVPGLIRGIKAGLMMLNKTRAMEVMQRVGELLILALRGKGPSRLTQKETDRLADAMVSIEYYMETVRAGRKEPWYMLDNAEACLGVLQETVERLRSDTGSPLAPEAELATAGTAEDADEEPGLQKLHATDVLSAPVVAQDAEHLDPDLLELFIEEAKEEVASIRRNLPQWSEAPDDMEALITVRRSFHTLKGSGRMVGAERIGEYCWSIENLLNKLINRTLNRTPPMVQFIVDAAKIVPELIEQLEIGSEPGADVALFIARANAFADGDPNAAVLSLAPDDERPGEAEDTALEMDPVLLDIYAKETAGHLKVIQDYIASCAEHRPPYPVTDKLHRACHTLHGSANMANVERGVSVAGAANRFVRRLYDHDLGMSAEGLDALRSAVRALATIVGDINQGDRDRDDYAALVEHLHALATAVDTPNEPVAEVERPPERVEEPEPEAGEADYDAEIAAIFSEEAAELLEAADEALSQWTRDKGSREQLDELKRHLHTLKGGARMAGIMAMGNLSHELETLLIGVDDGRIKPSAQLDELLQQSVDELHRMRDIVIAGKRVSAATDLEHRIKTVSAAGGVAAETAAAPGVETPAEESVSVDDSVSVEFTPEPEDSVSMVIVDSSIEPPTAADEPAAIADFDIDTPAAEVPAAPPETAENAWAAERPGYVEEEGLAAEASGHVVEAAEAAGARGPEEPLSAPPAAGEELPHPDTARRRPRQSADHRQEFARIDAALLEDLLNAAGEISIYHSRLSQQISSIDFNLEELEQTVARLRDQLRKLEIETEAQIMHGHQDTVVARDFDPLEMDRYSNIQQLSRALAESANDMGSLRDLLQSQTSEAETLLVQQARVTAELQNGLMRTRMVPFQRHVPRLTRLVRQAAAEVGKRAELAVEGAAGELDRQVLDKMLPPFEHMLRNAVIHGIETPEVRLAAGKPAGGRITIRLHREGAEMVIDVADDGAGLDVESIRRKAFEKNLLSPDAKVSDAEIMDLILKPGFSTAKVVTQSAGRGVGMDVVANEVKQLGGSLKISSVTGQGTNFTVRLPFTLAITQALIVRTGDEIYALPLPTVEGVVRVGRSELESRLSQSKPTFQYGEESYRFRHLGMYLGGPAAQLPEDESFIPIILVRAGEFSSALLFDELIASQEIVVKSVGPQLTSVRGISGATILGDGRIVLILDINSLVRAGAPIVELKSAAPAPTDDRPVAMVVDDSITVRRVMERFLERNGMRVVTAKDGLDAISVLRDNRPDIILLDIEMPRMDGYEFATHVRNDERVADVPIIMITSRTGEKHRARAIEIGVDDYLGKPYQESQLMEAISRLLAQKGIAIS
jgi:chemosensory pili system protein ChpA (sensor histidine kinase/response regulator)